MKDPLERLPKGVAERLGPFYVYVLVDPRDQEIFYVGQGQHDRLLQHGKEAHMRADGERNSDKVKHINEIRTAKEEPQIDVIKHNLDETTAKQVEAALIDCLPNLTNQKSGHEAGTGRRTELLDLIAQHTLDEVPDGAPPALVMRLGDWMDFDKPKEVEKGCFREGCGWRPNLTDQQKADGIRCWWYNSNISEDGTRHRNIKHAVAVHNGITRYVYEIVEGSWISKIDGEDKRGRSKKRWAFKVRPAKQDVWEAWIGTIGKRIKFKKGHMSGAAYWPSR